MRWIGYGLVALVLVGCSSAPEKPEPTELKRLQARVALAELASINLGSGDVTGLVPSASPLGVVAASGAGELSLLDEGTLAKIWSVDVGAPITGGVATNGTQAFVATADGQLVAWDLASGAEQFRVQLPGVSSTPAIADSERVYVKTQIGRLLAYSVVDGRQVWLEEVQENRFGIRGGAPMTLAPGALFVLWESGRLLAYQPETGRVLWERQVAFPSGRTPLERIVDSKAAPSLQGFEMATATRNGQVSVMDARTGRVLWSRDADAFSGAVLGFNAVTVVATDGTLSGFNARTGEPLWTQTGLRYRELSAPAIFANAIAVVDLDGVLHLIDPTDGDLVGRLDVGSAKGVVAPVTTARGLLVQLQDGRLTLVSGSR